MKGTKMATKREQLEKKLSEIKAQIAKLNAKEAQETRKQETRKKILLGAWVLSKIKSDNAYAEKIQAEMDKFLTQERDRKLFGLAIKTELREGE